MKIGLLHNSILPPKNYGGIERIVLTLAKQYTNLGHEVVIFCRRGSAVSEYERVELDPGYAGEDLSSYIPKDLDFLHSHQPLKVKPPVPFLITTHGNGHPGQTYFANNNFLSQSHARNHNGKHYIYNGVDPSHYPFTTRKDDFYVFLARTTWSVKNLKTAITWANEHNVPLEIMGGSGISRGNIHYNGLVDEEKKLELLSKAKALVYPTNWDEPCAAAPLEALACGTPVISSVNGCMPELVREGTGVVCRNYSEMMAAKDKLETVSAENCRKSVEEFFSLERMTKDYLEMFEKILEEGELDHSPKYNFDKKSITYLYKPTLKNRLQLALRKKI